jgi:hypothetical protein
LPDPDLRQPGIETYPGFCGTSCPLVDALQIDHRGIDTLACQSPGHSLN